MSETLDSQTTVPDQVMEDYLFELFDETDEKAAAAGNGVEIQPYEDVLAFDCAGVKIAIDAARVSERRLIADFNQPLSGGSEIIDLEANGRSIRLLALAALILPAELPRRKAPVGERSPEVVMLDEGYGLLLGKRLEGVKLSPAENRWRKRALRKPWLAGINKEQKVVLLDVEQLLKVARK